MDGDPLSSRKVRRFYQRCFTGMAVKGRLRFLTLTTSDEAMALDIHKSWRKLVMRLRRRFGAFEYMGVREHKGERQHLHIIFRGAYLEQSIVSALWGDIHKSPVVDIRAVRGQRAGVSYIAKYLSKETASRYWASYGWVFKGWVGLSRACKRWLGHYPSRFLLVQLAEMEAQVRKGALFWLTRRLPMEYSMRYY